jgi:hypothetical protein
MHKSFSEDARRIRPLLNDTVDLHFKQSTIIEILSVPKSDSIRIMSSESGNRILSLSPESGQPRFRRPYSGWLAGSGQNIPARMASRPDLASRSGQNGRLARQIKARTASRSDLARTAGFRLVCRNPANPDFDEIVRIPAFILDPGYSSRNGEIR